MEFMGGRVLIQYYSAALMSEGKNCVGCLRYYNNKEVTANRRASVTIQDSSFKKLAISVLRKCNI